MKALGLDIGFLFQKRRDLREACGRARRGAAPARRPHRSDETRRAEFQNKLAEYRNTYLDHRDEQPDPTMVGSFHRLDAAETMFENVWRAIEDYVALYVIANLPPTIQVVEIPEEQRDPARPIRFRFELLNTPDAVP